MLNLRRLLAKSRLGFQLQHTAAVAVKNEPILEFKPGSSERQALEKALNDLKQQTLEVPCVIGGEHAWTDEIRYQLCPFNHSHKVAKFCYADKDLINKAINAALSAHKEWDLKPVEDRAQIFFKAADLISGSRRAELLARTMIGQGKTVIQAEIDAAAELIDFFRFNAKYAVELQHQQPISESPSTNSTVYRSLEGFVAAVSPFNFTAIGGNLAGAPALMGNVVLWKPSDTAIAASHAVYKILLEAGLPPNVIQFVPTDGPLFGETITESEHLAGINFTGSVPTFRQLWKQVSEKLHKYRTFPRLSGECGGKNFHFVHKSADTVSVVNGTIRSAFEYGGQKCSACSRMYVPDSLWPEIKKNLLEEHKKIKVGNEIFGPIVAVYVYPENKYQEILQLIDTSTPYGLTGAVFAQDKNVVAEACKVLRYSAGNFYINDKSTGSVVAQQPFGGARISGTNDKPGGPHYILRWTSPQSVKETHVPLTTWRYPYME
ncbi:delta-1-pyrroline-5-carboxylate dehydrogenase, mitochondrial isoform X3 [Heptranchias perlo]|uniref:delta-1-pyrroline-5-carboxylate dehydrogenase, mitochondrial isoform X3 n=1 Tax=Heptranchias perlo TaxID=212740 RepID=UPI003559424C